jgi:hypothetical protein
LRHFCRLPRTGRGPRAPRVESFRRVPRALRRTAVHRLHRSRRHQ